MLQIVLLVLCICFYVWFLHLFIEFDCTWDSENFLFLLNHAHGDEPWDEPQVNQ